MFQSRASLDVVFGLLAQALENFFVLVELVSNGKKARFAHCYAVIGTSWSRWIRTNHK